MFTNPKAIDPDHIDLIYFFLKRNVVKNVPLVVKTEELGV
jgi:hypothetical protein